MYHCYNLPMTVRVGDREIDGFLFDVDGTLYGKKEHGRIFDAIQLQLAVALLATSGKPELSDDEISLMRSKYLGKVAETGKWQRSFIELGGSPDQYRILAGDADRSRHLNFNPELRLTLGKIKALPTKLGILTSAKTEVTKNTCRKLLGDDWNNLFEAVVCEDSLPSNIQKPDLRAFQFANEKLGVSPERVVMVGDSIGDDLLPAATLGMLTVYVGEKADIGDLRISRIENLQVLID